MAVDVTSTIDLLNTLVEALDSATTAFPTDEQSLVPPTDGISLLDIKNDLLLSYLQNLVFIIILRLRNSNGHAQSASTQPEDCTSLNDGAIKKLIELRVYLERGVRPLEGKLRYQIDKVLRAAEDAERAAAQKQSGGKIVKKSKVSNKNTERDSSEDSNEESGGESDGSEGEDADTEDEESLHRPNAAALMKKVTAAQQKDASRSKSLTRGRDGNGTYKPPRITPTAMPVQRSARDRDGADDISRRRKSTLLEEYIDEEVSTAPRAQPSIGSNNTILDRGRSGLSTRDREKQRERLEYEERNFVRLPAESKSEKRKARLRGDQNQRDMFGGEDWTGLGGLGDRINKSVQGKGSSALDRRRKRGRDTEDGPRGDGMSGGGIGETFEKRRRVLQDRAERKTNKRR